MQFSTVRRYTHIALAERELLENEPGLGVVDRAARLGVTVRTLGRIRAWHRKESLELTDTGKLEAEIRFLDVHIAKLEKLADRLLKGATAKIKRAQVVTDDSGKRKLRDVDTGEVVKIYPNAHEVASIEKVILEYRTRRLELLGLYKQVLNIQVSGSVEHKHYDLSSLTTEELRQLRDLNRKARIDVRPERN